MTDLIYERKGAKATRSADDFDTKPLPKNNTRMAITEFDKDSIAPRVLPSLSDKKIKARVRKSKSLLRRRRIKVSLLSAAAIAFCLFTLDNRLLDGYFTGKAKDAFFATTDKESLVIQNRTQNTTLYTRLEYDGGALIEPSIREMEQSFSQVTTDTTVATQQSSPAFSDGTAYYPITRLDLSPQSHLSLSNATSYNPDLSELSAKSPSALQNLTLSEQPLVLIIHTHGGESYSDYVDMYPKGNETRSLDTNKNVVRVGKEIANTLSSFGIASIHCEIMHDEKSFINAYNESAKTVEKYLAEYPSVKFVIDVHRDAIIKSDGEAVKAVKTIGGEDYAQLMLVVGTDERGHAHDNWKDNLSLALTLQESIEATYPGLCRSINLRDVPFNQWLSEGYLLLEVGTCSNTLDEALRGARAFAENLARVIYNS